MLTVRVHERAGDLDARRWDSVGADPFSASAVLAALEAAELPGVRLWYATVEDGRGRLLGAAPFARVEVDARCLTHGLFRSAIGGVRRVRPGFLRTALLVCGTPLSVGNPAVRLVPGAGADERLAVYRALGGTAAELAEAQAAPWRAFKELREPDLAPATRALAGAGWFLAPSEPGAELALPWGSYERYVASLRSPYRYKLRLSARRLERAGVAVEVLPLAGTYDARLHALYEAVVDRAAVRLERLTPGFFTALGRALPDRTRLVVFRRDGVVVGWVAMLFDGSTAYDLFHGIDYSAAPACDLYFNQLAAVVRTAIENGARVLSLGQSTEVAKARFGARPVPLWVALRHRSAALNTFLRAARRPLFPARSYPGRRVFARPDEGAAARPAAAIGEQEAPARRGQRRAG